MLLGLHPVALGEPPQQELGIGREDVGLIHGHLPKMLRGHLGILVNSQHVLHGLEARDHTDGRLAVHGLEELDRGGATQAFERAVLASMERMRP